MEIEQLTPSTVSVKQVTDIWKENEVLIFIIDLNEYPSPCADYLNEIEKAHLDTLKTEYFKKRYIVSRMVLKSLSGLLKEKPWSCISTIKDECGRVHVCDYNDLHVCIAYSENIIVLAISKIDLGIDIEVIRSRSVTSISKSIDRSLPDGTSSKDSSDFLIMWTLKEAYCKLSNRTMFSNLSRKLDLSDVYNLSYIIDNKYLLALVTKSRPPKVSINHLQKIDYFI